MKVYKYKGLLAKRSPTMLPIELWFADFPTKQKAWNDQREKLVSALFEDCDVPRDSEDGWKRVALALASRHIKAFASGERPKLGRRRENDDDYEVTLEMNHLIGAGKKIRDAARIIAKRRGKGESQEAIEQRYRRTMADWKKAHVTLKEAITRQRK